MGRDGSVGIATRYGAGRPWDRIPMGGEIFCPRPDRPWAHLAFYTMGKCRGKAVPLQARSGPEGTRNLRFPDYMTTAQDGGKCISLTHRPPLPPGNAPGTHFC